MFILFLLFGCLLCLYYTNRQSETEQQDLLNVLILEKFSRQILIYRSALSQVSHLYYKRVGQSPYPFVGRGFTPAAFFDSRRSLRREQAPALRCNPIITQIGRENKFSAEFFRCTCRGGVSPPVLSFKIGCSREGRPLPYSLVIQTSL